MLGLDSLRRCSLFGWHLVGTVSCNGMSGVRGSLRAVLNGLRLLAWADPLEASPEKNSRRRSIRIRGVRDDLMNRGLFECVKNKGVDKFGGIAVAASGRNDRIADLDGAVLGRAEIPSTGTKGLALTTGITSEGVPAVPPDVRWAERLELGVEELKSVAVVLARRPPWRDGDAEERAESAGALKLGLDVLERGGDEIETLGAQ